MFSFVRMVGNAIKTQRQILKRDINISSEIRFDINSPMVQTRIQTVLRTQYTILKYRPPP